MIRKTLVVPALLGMLAPLLASCSDAGDSGSGGDAIVVGTTDALAMSEDVTAPLDPAAAYDVNSWNILQNTFQTLLRQPRTGTEPEPDAAESCRFTDRLSEAYRCKLQPGLKFSNGNALTSKDVKFSIDRMLDIRSDAGPFALLTNVDQVEAPDERTVVFHLKTPDATFPHKLATPAAAILDSEVYEPKKLREGFEISGSGPYTLKVEAKDKSATKVVYSRNENYKGILDRRNDKVELRFFKTSKAMEKSLRDGDIDLMNRKLDPKQLERLQEDSGEGIKVVESPGMEIRFLTFNTADSSVSDKAVRRAVAQTVDRGEIVREALRRTGEELYSMVPTGMGGHTTDFLDAFGEPDPKKAEKTLREAGIDEPVELTMHYTTDHYGPSTKVEFEVLSKQLNDTGLFDVTIEGVEWGKYYPAGVKGKYSIYGMGWFPDFPDPETYTAPFFGEDSTFATGYRNPAIESVIPRTRQQAERSATAGTFEQVQKVIAEDVPYLPLWQGKQYVAAQDSITGVDWALNSSSTLQLWELGRGVEG